MAQAMHDLTQASSSEIAVARGLLLLLAVPSVAALALVGGSPSLPAAFRMLGEIATLPAFYAVAGWALAEAIAAPGSGALLRAALPGALFGVAGAVFAVFSGQLADLDWAEGFERAAPAWSIALLPPVYALLARAFGGAPLALGALAIAAHVAGVILAKPTLVHFVFFTAGASLASRRESFVRFASQEPEFAVASAPFVAVLAAAVAVRFAQTGLPPSIAAVGPVALGLGLAAGPAALAAGAALAAAPLAEPLSRLGRIAPALAIFWLPLFSLLLAAANRGLAPSPASALLMAFASLLLIAVVADALLDMPFAGRFRRAAAPS